LQNAIYSARSPANQDEQPHDGAAEQPHDGADEQPQLLWQPPQHRRRKANSRQWWQQPQELSQLLQLPLEQPQDGSDELQPQVGAAAAGAPQDGAAGAAQDGSAGAAAGAAQDGSDAAQPQDGSDELQPQLLWQQP
jgi:hypothetical protein